MNAEYFLIVLCTVLIISIPVLITLLIKRERDLKKILTENEHYLENVLRDERALTNTDIRNDIQTSFTNMATLLNSNQARSSEQIEIRLQSFQQTSSGSMEDFRRSIENYLDFLRKDNQDQIDSLREIVEDRLQRTIDEKMSTSFNIVGQRLEDLYRGFGEMQALATGVGDLKRILSGVKTRGILGEVQLGTIIKEIMAPEQYETNCITHPGSAERVEYAVKMPGRDEIGILLPIDSKFPGDAYEHLLDAYDSGDKDAIDKAATTLMSQINNEAKDIRDKYIYPPYTTDFAILFVPFEGLYAEIINRGAVELLQNQYHINVAGPSTLAALLNSIQMGFRTLAIQQRSVEVWQILGAVKTEFDKFAETLEKTQKRLDDANHELDTLIGTRTRQIRKKLSSIERIDNPDSVKELLTVEDFDSMV